jgi:hypothetical protein
MHAPSRVSGFTEFHSKAHTFAAAKISREENSDEFIV